MMDYLWINVKYWAKEGASNCFDHKIDVVVEHYPNLPWGHDVY